MGTEQGERTGEVIEASTTEFTAQCYELYGLPPLGSLVKTAETSLEQYGIVYQAATSSIEPGRKPIARGRDEASSEDIYRANPQLARLLRSEFNALIVAHRQGAKLVHYLPAVPARIHDFVFLCPAEEVAEFSSSFAFLHTLVNARTINSADEVIAACLRQIAEKAADRNAYLVAAGKELSILLRGDLNRLKAVLEKIKP